MPITAVGVTGHRHLTEIDKIITGVEGVLRRLLETFPGSNFRVLSSLAEGADRILADKLLQVPKTTLWVSLPLPREDYLNDFRNSRSKEEFIHLLGKAERVIELPFKNNRDEAYLAAGKYIIENSDVLLAIWDGKSSRDRAGTGPIVALARDRSLPLIWIHASNHRSAPSFPVPHEAVQGSITYENFPPPE
ncbi:MAG: hypothetical protein ACXWNC_03030 [Anaerolineales bacterium]